MSASWLKNLRKYGRKGSWKNTFDLAVLDLKNYARAVHGVFDLKTSTSGDLFSGPSN